MCKFSKIILYKLAEPNFLTLNIWKLSLEKHSLANLLFLVWFFLTLVLSSRIIQKVRCCNKLIFTWVTLLNCRNNTDLMHGMMIVIIYNLFQVWLADLCKMMWHNLLRVCLADLCKMMWHNLLRICLADLCKMMRHNLLRICLADLCKMMYSWLKHYTKWLLPWKKHFSERC